MRLLDGLVVFVYFMKFYIAVSGLTDFSKLLGSKDMPSSALSFTVSDTDLSSRYALLSVC